MKIKQLVNIINNKIESSSDNELGILFKANNNTYFYDAGTNKVLLCNDVEYKIINYILEHHNLNGIEKEEFEEELLYKGLESVNNEIDKENILKKPKYNRFAVQEKINWEEREEHSITQIILELTEQCNLRCKYCIYNESTDKFRAFSEKAMDWEIAQKAIDYALGLSGKQIAVTFYGGEPLLQFDLMKKCIDYTIKEHTNDKEIHFGFTTNLTLMTKEKAEYFANLEFCSITCSIDGPEDIHDQNRCYQNGVGSFQAAMNGLKNLIEAYGNERAYKMININAVFSPPYTYKKIRKVYDFFNDVKWLPDNILITTTYKDEARDFISEQQINEARIFYKNSFHIVDPLQYFKFVNSSEDGQGKLRFGDDARMIRIHERMIVDNPIPFLMQNGCCMPGSRRLYITTDGQYKVCERIGNSPVIGDVYSGIDQESIKKYYIDEYCSVSIECCSTCWASQLCSICFANIYSKDGINLSKKRRSCIVQKCRIKNDLIMYYTLLNKNVEYIKRISVLNSNNYRKEILRNDKKK